MPININSVVKLVIVDDIYEAEPSLRENFRKNHNILAKSFFEVLTTKFSLMLLSKSSLVFTD